jgi:pyruvate dehydrogenase E2 component (dihydrolipoamide acetyltransferase)
VGEFKMPSLGADMQKGTLVVWNVKPGDRVKRGDIIAVVETEKGAFDTECYEEGVIERLLVESGSKVPVGTVLAIVRGEGAAPAPAGPTAAPAAERALAMIVARYNARTSWAVTPLARKIAAELGVDLTTVKGSGPGGAIERADVEQAAVAKKIELPAAAAAPAEAQEKFQAGMRRAIAAAMARSNRDIPHYYLQTRIDMTRALRWLEAENAKRSIKDRLLPAVAHAKGRRTRAQGRAGAQRLLDQRPAPAERRNPRRLRHLASKRRPRHARDPRDRSQNP